MAPCYSVFVQIVFLVPGFEHIRTIVVKYLLLSFWQSDIVWFRVELDHNLDWMSEDTTTRCTELENESRTNESGDSNSESIADAKGAMCSGLSNRRDKRQF